MSLPSNGWTRPSGKANCFSAPTNPVAACSNFTAIELVDCPMYGECEICISPKTSNASFWIGPRWWRAKEAPSAAGGALGHNGYQSTSWAYTPATGARVFAHMDRSCAPRRFIEGYLWCW
jgi:hypothetical protein